MFVPIRIFFEERIPWGVGERFLCTLTYALLRVPVALCGDLFFYVLPVLI